MLRNTVGAASAAILMLIAAAPAGAAPVTVGSPLSASFTQTPSSGLATGANTALPEPGARALSPFAGAVRRWRVRGTGTFTLRVLHPGGGGTFTSTAKSAPVSATGPGATVVTTALPIAAGDLVAIENGGPSDRIGLAGGPGASYAYWSPALATGDTRAPSTYFSGELAFNADVVPAPVISAITPGTGSKSGGTRVAIAGSDLTDATAVSFGDTPAASFTVDSDTSITAVAPPRAAGVVDIRVTTPSGTSTTSDDDHFAYATAAPPPASLPAPAPVGALASLVGAPSATASGVRLTVACGASAGRSCALATRLVVIVSKRRARAASVDKAKKAKRAYLTVGARKAKIKSGAKWTATVSLDRSGRRLLRRGGHLTVRVVTTSTTSGGERTVLPASSVTIKR